LVYKINYYLIIFLKEYFLYEQKFEFHFLWQIQQQMFFLIFFLKHQNNKREKNTLR